MSYRKQIASIRYSGLVVGVISWQTLAPPAHKILWRRPGGRLFLSRAERAGYGININNED